MTHIDPRFGAHVRRAATLPSYPDAVLESAEQALALILDDQPWPLGEALVPWGLVLQGLRSKGFTLGQVNALVERLTRAGVFTYHRTVKPAGSSWENGYRVFRSEQEVHESFVTTREDWLSYLRGRAEAAQIESGNQAGPTPAKEPTPDRDQGGTGQGNGGREDRPRDGAGADLARSTPIDSTGRASEQPVPTGRVADILRVMLTEGWTSPKKAASQDVIADQIQKGLERRSLSRAWQKLRAEKWITTTGSGANAGTYLTSAGIEQAQRYSGPYCLDQKRAILRYT